MYQESSVGGPLFIEVDRKQFSHLISFSFGRCLISHFIGCEDDHFNQMMQST